MTDTDDGQPGGNPIEITEGSGTAQPGLALVALPTRKPVSARMRRQLAAFARGELRGDTIDVTAGELGVSVSTGKRCRRHPAYADALSRQRATLRRDAEVEADAARPEAIGALRGILRAARDTPGVVPAVEVVRAAGAILAASAPPSERQRHAARAEILAALPVRLRREVVRVLTEGDDAIVRAMTDEELDRLLAEETR